MLHLPQNPMLTGLIAQGFHANYAQHSLKNVITQRSFHGVPFSNQLWSDAQGNYLLQAWDGRTFLSDGSQNDHRFAFSLLTPTFPFGRLLVTEDDHDQKHVILEPHNIEYGVGQALAGPFVHKVEGENANAWIRHSWFMNGSDLYINPQHQRLADVMIDQLYAARDESHFDLSEPESIDLADQEAIAFEQLINDIHQNNFTGYAIYRLMQQADWFVEIQALSSLVAMLPDSHLHAWFHSTLAYIIDEPQQHLYELIGAFNYYQQMHRFELALPIIRRTLACLNNPHFNLSQLDKEQKLLTFSFLNQAHSLATMAGNSELVDEIKNCMKINLNKQLH